MAGTAFCMFYCNLATCLWQLHGRASRGFTGMNDEDDAAPHLLAIQDIQRVEKEDIDRITSSLVRLRACM